MLGNGFFLTFAAWPAVLLTCSLANMLIWGKFGWAEALIFAPLAGMVIGASAWWGLQPSSGGAAGFFRGLLLIFSHGWVGLVRLCDGLADPAKFFWWSASATVAATLLAAGLDHAASGPHGGGEVALSIPMFLLKAPFCLVSTALGLLIMVVGLIHAAATSGDAIGMVGGTPYEEWDHKADPKFYATTVGATFHVWQGHVEHVWIHERYHTRQCIYFHDWMIPFWCIGFVVTGGQAGEANPMENVAYQIQTR